MVTSKQNLIWMNTPINVYISSESVASYPQFLWMYSAKILLHFGRERERKHHHHSQVDILDTTKQHHVVTKLVRYQEDKAESEKSKRKIRSIRRHEETRRSWGAINRSHGKSRSNGKVAVQVKTATNGTQ